MPRTRHSVAAALTDKTRAIFVESIANPGGLVIDLPAISAIARKANIPLIVDNTLATPHLCRPKEHGADIVVHSLTKFMGGHGNSIGGAIVDSGTFDWLGAKHRYKTLVEPNPSYNGMVLAETFGNFAFAIACRVMGLRDIGPSISPFNAFLLLTGIETLPLRMQRHTEKCAPRRCVARETRQGSVGELLGPAVEPEPRPGETPVSQGSGAVFTFGLKGGYEAGVALVSALKLFSHLANIGDVRSLVIHPASTTHRQLTDAQRAAAGAGPEGGPPLDRHRGCGRYHRRSRSGTGVSGLDAVEGRGRS